MLGLLGWDPYLKTVIAVDDDVDITDDSEVLWALATRFQPAEDIVILERLPGSALDPSSTPDGSTSRMGLDATRGPGVQRRPHPHLRRRACERGPAAGPASSSEGREHMNTHDLTVNDWDVAGEERFYRSLRRYWHPVLYADRRRREAHSR